MRIFTFIIAFCFTYSSFGQTSIEQRLQIGFYNLENLFHPSNDSLTRDDEFTPEGQRYWSFYRYKQKCNRLGKVILSMGKGQAPACLGVAEVENKEALEDLAASPPLRKFNYRAIHFTSPDRRGIDVAALYQPSQLKLDTAIAIPVKMPADSNFKTRDILYLKLLPLAWADTLHVFYNHWPSRYGGQAQSEPKRMAAAQILKNFCDSLLLINPNATIIIAGDFNDEPENLSISETLKAGPPSGNAQLINLALSEKPNSGSHRYRGVWSFLDQIIVSQGLYTQKGPSAIATNKMIIHQPSFLLEQDARYPGVKPYRTYVGFKYQEGFSDHLPVYLTLEKT